MSRALFLHGPHDARVAPFNLREGQEGETLLDVAAVGLCGSDLHYYKDGGIGSAVIREPFVPGHEFGGYLSEDVTELGLPRGALVAVDPNRACGVCEHCRAGHPNLCPNVKFIGAPPFDGAMTERIWVPKSQIVPLPEGMSPLEAVMLEPLGVAIHAVDLAKPRLLERVAVLGCGPIGLLILQVLKVAGAGEIVAVDPLPHRRAMAKALGAAQVGEGVADIRAWTDNEGCPLVVEATNSPDGFRAAVLAARIGGRVVLVGIPAGDVYTLPAAAARFWTRELTAMVVVSTVLAALSGLVGLLVSYHSGVPSGPAIILVAGGFYMLSLLFGPVGGLVPRLAPRRHLEA